MPKKRVMVTLTGGGFLWESQSLIKCLGNEYEYHFVTTPDSVGKARIINIPDGEIHTIAKPTTMNITSNIRKAINTLQSFRDAYNIIKKIDPFAVICLGSSVAIPLCFCGKCLRKQTIFVETITRISKPSLTGKILSAFKLCDRLYVQWPEAIEMYNGAIYRGTVI
jgi:beta-1,4-N-acetylglucosaminyltransferase